MNPLKPRRRAAQLCDPEAGDQYFAYEFDRRYQPLFLTLGVTSADGVVVTGDGRMIATYGHWGTETPATNIEEVEIGGPYRWWTAVGLRLSFVDSGLTMGTNYERGLCMKFRQPIHRVIGPRDHAGLWVSVADCDGLANAIIAHQG